MALLPAEFADLSSRSRLCLLGADRAKFLHGQVTNSVTGLLAGQGCYAALVSAKGRLQSDLHIYALENELLLDFEPGLTAVVKERLEKYIIAEDVQVVDAAPHYGLLTVQGTGAKDALQSLILPSEPNGIVPQDDLYIAQRARTGSDGFDLYVPKEKMAAMAGQLGTVAQPANEAAWETARIELGRPRFGVDMDETNLAPEALGAEAISYAKGCYIGQEVIARIRTYGQVARALRGLELSAPAKRGDKLFKDEKEVGHITSSTWSDRLQRHIALGYVRREANEYGTQLVVVTASGPVTGKVVKTPFAL